MDIKLVQADIVTLKVDAIVNAANTSLLGGSGVDGAIHRAAGPKLLDECRLLNGCNVGEAKITLGYLLPAKHVIHTVGPIYSSEIDQSDLLKNCYINSLNLAKSHNLKSIAFPAISTGAYLYPMSSACQIAVSTVIKWQKSNADYPLEIIFCVYSKESYDICLKVLKEHSIVC